jgi:hypothetical protein
MNSMTIAALTALCTVTFAGAAEANYYKGGKKKRAANHGYAYAQPYPYASERQRQNTHAYENGGYYERIQSAHVFGSRGWWDLQSRGGGRR